MLTNYLSRALEILCRAHELLSRAHELLSRAHDIISQSENTKYIHECCLKLADSRNNINILFYFNAECRYLGTKVYIHC